MCPPRDSWGPEWQSIPKFWFSKLLVCYLESDPHMCSLEVEPKVFIHKNFMGSLSQASCSPQFPHYLPGAPFLSFG